MKNALFAFTASSLSAATALAGPITENQTFPVPGFAWIVLEKPTSNGNVAFAAGDSCSIQRGGFVSIVGFSDDNKRALVRYSLPQQTFGAPCPSGAVFFLTTDALSSFPEAAKEADKEEMDRSSEVDRLLKGEMK